MGSQTHLRAVNKSIRALNLEENAKDAALVELLRVFARQMDESAGSPALNLSRSYHSALKDMYRSTEAARALARQEAAAWGPPAVPDPESPSPAPPQPVEEPDDLASFRRKKGGRAS